MIWQFLSTHWDESNRARTPTVIPILLIVITVLMLVIERVWPGQSLPVVRGWWWRIAFVNAAQLGLVLLAGITWDRWCASVSLNHLGRWMGDVPSALVAYLVSTFVYYWWHRLRHESKLFWRICHQLHHSPSRIELLASFYKHPVEIFLNSVISSLLVYTLLGCSIRAAAIYTLLTAVAEYFYHWNIRTPRWIGWLVQRPESHRVHHQYNHHTQNYADLPVWDWLFGTLKNPKESPARCGFDREKEARVTEMLAFRDVHRTPAGPLPICFGCKKRWACAAGKAATSLKS